MALCAVLVLAGDAGAVDALAPACGVAGDKVVLTGVGSRAVRIMVGGKRARLVRKSKGKQSRAFVVPKGLASGPTAVVVRTPRKKVVTLSFQIAGPEVCDGVDNDCSGLVDDGVIDLAGGRCHGGRLVGAGEPAGGEGCVPETIEACYDGPPQTRHVGICRDGTRVCDATGTFGSCNGQVLPAAEDPGNGVDENCDGRDGPGGGELCVPGAMQPCYDGPPTTRDVGVCHGGMRDCGESGLFGLCEGQALPAAEQPGNQIDENCDGSDEIVAPVLRLSVTSPFSPTFQSSQVIAGAVDAAVAPPTPEPDPPLVAGIDPTSGVQGETLNVTIQTVNSSFQANATSAAFGPGIVVNSVTVQGPTEATANITILGDAALGPRVVSVASGAQEAFAANAFTVLPSTRTLTGRVLDPDGNPVPGAQVCVAGTALCTTANGLGLFTLAGVASNAGRLVVNASGFAELSVALGMVATGDADLGDLAFLRTVELPPPPPQPGAPPLPPALASIVARQSTLSPENLTLEQARKLVIDTILLVGGEELGVLDADGNQLNPDVAGNGPISLKDEGVTGLALALTQDAHTTLEDWAVGMIISFQWTTPPGPPPIDDMIAVLQERVDEAWADPEAPESALAILLFNPGASFTKLPPVLSRATRISVLHQVLLVDSLMVRDFDRTVRAPDPVRLAFHWGTPDTASDARIVLANHGPGEPSMRQMSRLQAGLNAFILAIVQTQFGNLLYNLPTISMLGAVTLVQVVGNQLGIAYERFIGTFLLLARIAPDPPGIVSARQVGNEVIVQLRRTPHDTDAFAAGATNERLGHFTYTLYRWSAGKRNRIVSSQRVPRNEDSPTGVFTILDPFPDLGLNEYYADVVQDVRVELPGFFDEFSFAKKRGLGLTGPYYYSDLLSDYSIPNPYMTVFNRGGVPISQLEAAQVFFTPVPDGSGASRFGRIGALRVTRQHDVYVSDVARQKITFTRNNSTADNTLANTGFNAPQTVLVMNRAEMLFTENAGSEGKFGGRLFRFDGSTGERTFVGTVTKYSPILDRGTAVSVPALTTGPPLRDAITRPNLDFSHVLNDLYVADNFSSTIRRVSTSIIPLGGIGMLPAPGHGIFGSNVASPIVGSIYATLPECDQGPIVDLEFDPDDNLFILTKTALFRVPYDVSRDAPKPIELAAALGCPGASVFVTVTPDAVGSFTVPTSLLAKAAPCGGTFSWSIVEGADRVRLGAQTDGVGTSERLATPITPLVPGQARIRVRYDAPGGSSEADVVLTVPGATTTTTTATTTTSTTTTTTTTTTTSTTTEPTTTTTTTETTTTDTTIP